MYPFKGGSGVEKGGMNMLGWGAVQGLGLAQEEVRVEYTRRNRSQFSLVGAWRTGGRIWRAKGN